MADASRRCCFPTFKWHGQGCLFKARALIFGPIAFLGPQNRAYLKLRMFYSVNILSLIRYALRHTGSTTSPCAQLHMISSSQSSIRSAKKHFATQQIALLSMSNGGGGAARSSSYVKENDIKFGVSVASRQLHMGTVNGLRCRFCLAFGREEKSGSKRKATHLGQAWTSPFRYENIETHMKNQHAMKWAEYEEAKKDWDYTSRKEQSDSFFENIGNKSSSVKSHFRSHLSPPLGASTTSIAVSMKPSIYIVEKDIVEVIIGDMYYSAPQVLLQQGTIEDNGIDEDNDTSIDDIWNGMGAAEAEDGETSHQQQDIPIFASAAEREAKHANRLANAMQTKQRALSLFEKQKVINVNHNEEQEGENDPRVACASNLQRISDLLK